MADSPTISIVDDDAAVRRSLVALVGARGLASRTYASGEEFLAAYDPAQPGCLIVDVRMQGMSGLELMEELQRRGAMPPTIMITGFADVPQAVRAMRTGAVTFLEKPCLPSELWEAIEAALERDRLERELIACRHEIGQRLDQLTPDEEAVLEKMLEGLPNKRIASELDIGLRTVELRRSNIMKKMEADSLAGLIRLVLTVRDDAGESRPSEE